MSSKITIHINGVTGKFTSAFTKHILLTALQGYIGGTILARLLEHPKATSFRITALLRDPVKAEKLKSFGVEPIVGSLDDAEVVEKAAASDADIVIATVSSCHKSPLWKY